MTVLAKHTGTFADPLRSPSFVDLRAFAREAAQNLQEQPAGANPFLDNRGALISSGMASPVATLALTSGDGRVDCLPHAEFLIILSGDLHLTCEDATYDLGPQDAAVIPQGCGFSWRSAEGAQAVLLSSNGSWRDARAITLIASDPTLAPSGKPVPELLLGPAPECRNFNDFLSDDGTFVCGTWESTPYQRKGFLYRHFEIMLLTQGSVTLTDQHGHARQFETGDLLLAEAGSHCAWDSQVDVRKIFAILRV